MALFKKVTKDEFVKAFNDTDTGKEKNFTVEAREILFDYLSNNKDSSELNIIKLSNEWIEVTTRECIHDNPNFWNWVGSLDKIKITVENIDAYLLEWLNEQTAVFKFNITDKVHWLYKTF
jgi:hypothetical protein